MKEKEKTFSERAEQLSPEKKKWLEKRLSMNNNLNSSSESNCQGRTNPNYLSHKDQDKDAIDEKENGLLRKLFSFLLKKYWRFFFEHIRLDVPDSKLLVTLKTSESGHNIFVVPGGLGERNEILVFARLFRLMKQEHSFFAFRSGVYDANRRPKNLKKHAECLVDECEKMGLNSNAILIGECSGTAISLAVYHEMTKRKIKVHSLILLDPGTLDYLKNIRERKKKYFIDTDNGLLSFLNFKLLFKRMRFLKRRRFDSIAHYYKLLSQIPLDVVNCPLSRSGSPCLNSILQPISDILSYLCRQL